MMPQGFGDDMLHFNGIGERITWAMNGINGVPPEADKAKYYEIVRWAAQRGLTVTMHWNTDANVDQLLGIWERVNKEFPIAPLRWTIAHLNDASPQTLQRMKALGVGWTVQDAMYNTGDDVVKREAGDKIGRQPPVVTGSRIGVADRRRYRCAPRVHVQPVHRASVVPRREECERDTRCVDPKRLRAARRASLLHVRQRVGVARRTMCVARSKWASCADLAVLSKDYTTVAVDQIGSIESLLTMVGGKVVYAAGPSRRWTRRTQQRRTESRASPCIRRNRVSRASCRLTLR